MAEEWRPVLIQDVISCSKGQCIDFFDREDVLAVMEERAAAEKNIHQHQRLGYMYILSLSETGITKFVNEVAAVWPEPEPDYDAEPQRAGYLVTFSLKLTGKFDRVGVWNEIKPYLEANLPSCEVLNIRAAFSHWCDILVSYSSFPDHGQGVASMMAVLEKIPWVTAVFTKKATDFGRRTTVNYT